MVRIFGRIELDRLTEGMHSFRSARVLFAWAMLGLCATVTTSRAHAQDLDSMPKLAAPSRGDPQNGKRLYDKYGCYECHGGQGQGSPLSGPRIGPSPTPLSGFVTYIRRPTGQMPPYTRRITTDAELIDMYAFLQSLPQPPDVAKIPLLKAQPATGKR
jgi:mono/diheme cytochrome c family protein